MEKIIVPALYCPSCGAQYEQVSTDKTDAIYMLCPICASTKRVVFGAVDAAIKPPTIWMGLAGGPKVRSTPHSRKKYKWELQFGRQIEKRSGRSMEKVRLINRVENRYYESVTDPATGQVIHRVCEPLDEHVGHGSARTKNN